MKDELYQLVVEAMWHAKLNGENFENWTAEEIAVDMLDYDADIDGHDLDKVVACVKKIRKEE